MDTRVELKSELNALPVGQWPSDTTRTPREGLASPTKSSPAITTETVCCVSGPIGRQSAAQNRNELTLLHHLGKVAPHRPFTSLGNPLANLRCGYRAGNKLEDHWPRSRPRARTVPSGPADDSASLHPRHGITITLVPRHALHNRRHRHELGELIAVFQNGALPVKR